MTAPSPVFEGDHAFRFFLKSVMEHLPTIYIQFSKEFPPVAAEDLGIVPVSLQRDFIRALFFEYHVGRQWGSMWEQYYGDMATSARNYVLTVLNSCIEVYQASEPFYERFLDIFGMVAAVSLAFSIGRDFHVYAAPILIAFFEKFMVEDFYRAGGWAGLEEYVEGLPYLDWYFVRKDMIYKDVREQFNQEVNWRRTAKSYHRWIRLVSTADAFDDPACHAMADMVLTMDTSVCDRSMTAEDVLGDREIAKVRASLQQESNEPLRLNLKDREIVDRDMLANDITLRVSKLYNQAEFEKIMLKGLSTLVKRIRLRLMEAEKYSDTLKLLYSWGHKENPGGAVLK